MGLDPLTAAVSVFDAWLMRRQIDKWARLCFQMAFSFWVSACSSCGTMLVAHQPIAVAVGSGLIAGSSAMLFLYVRSPLTKDLQVAIPKDLAISEASQEFETVKGGK